MWIGGHKERVSERNWELQIVEHMRQFANGEAHFFILLGYCYFLIEQQNEKEIKLPVIWGLSENYRKVNYKR